MRVERIELWDGYREVNGRVHGSQWKPLWQVVVTFETEAAARQFMEKSEQHSEK